MEIIKWGSRNWAVYDDDDELVCVTLYKKGAKEVVRRLTENNLPYPYADNSSAGCDALRDERRMKGD